MANTYTTKLGLAKPAHGDINWHIPVNGNWDELDSMLGPLYEDITSGASALTLNKSIDANSKSIENVNILEAVKLKTTTYKWINDPLLTCLRYSDSTTVNNNYLGGWITVKTAPAVRAGISGTITVYYDVTSQIDGSASARVIKNGNAVDDGVNANKGNATNTVNVSIEPDDVIALQLITTSGMMAYSSIFSFYAIAIPALDESETWT